MKGLFIPEITAEMFRNGCLESIEALMAEGEIYDIEYSPWIPVSERLPESLMVKTLVSCEDANGLPINTMVAIYDTFSKTWDCEYKVIAWMPLPEGYKAESEDDVNADGK